MLTQPHNTSTSYVNLHIESPCPILETPGESIDICSLDQAIYALQSCPIKYDDFFICGVPSPKPDTSQLRSILLEICCNCLPLLYHGTPESVADYELFTIIDREIASNQHDPEYLPDHYPDNVYIHCNELASLQQAEAVTVRDLPYHPATGHERCLITSRDVLYFPTTLLELRRNKLRTILSAVNFY